MIHLVEPPVPVITIDGASGTGKGAVTLLVATRLNWHLLDSGALYRVLALAAQKHGVAIDCDESIKQNECVLERLAEHLDVQFVPQKDNFSQVVLEGENVTSSIRTEKIGNAASRVAVLPGVREALLSRQRAFKEAPGLIADGRDMGTVVFPDADLKIFLQATAETRAQRRFNQLKEQGINVTLSDLVNELYARDKRDRERVAAPLKPAEDAVCIDTDKLTLDQVVKRILSEIERKKAFPAIYYQNNWEDSRVENIN